VPSHAPPLADGETLGGPDATTILSAVKVTGKTKGGLSIGAIFGDCTRKPGRGWKRLRPSRTGGVATPAYRSIRTWDTRRLRGGPALRMHDYYTASGGMHSDGGRRAYVSIGGQRSYRRFDLYGPDEIAPTPDGRAYDVTERQGAAFSFANPDFSLRQFRSNLVLRWEYTPGSSLYLVWSQRRTGADLNWVGRFGNNWSELWRTRPDNAVPAKVSYWVSP